MSYFYYFMTYFSLLELKDLSKNYTGECPGQLSLAIAAKEKQEDSIKINKVNKSIVQAKDFLKLPLTSHRK